MNSCLSVLDHLRMNWPAENNRYAVVFIEFCVFIIVFALYPLHFMFPQTP